MPDQKPSLAVVGAPGTGNEPAPAKRSKWGTKPHAYTLAEAIKVVSVLADTAFGAAQIPASVIAATVGNTVTSSSFQRKVSGLKAFGLLADAEKGDYQITTLGLEVARPTDPATGKEAARRAFLSVEQFQKIFDRNKGKVLPAPEFLRNLLEQECSIPKEWSAEWVEHFRKGADVAGVLQTMPDGRVLLTESSPRSLAHEVIASVIIPTEQTQAAPSSAIAPKQALGINEPGGHKTVLPLSGSRIAEFRIPGDLTAKDAARIKKFLGGLDAMIDSLVIEE